MSGLFPGHEFFLHGCDKGKSIVDGRQEASRFALRLRSNQLRLMGIIFPSPVRPTRQNRAVCVSIVNLLLLLLLLTCCEEKFYANDAEKIDARFDVIGAPYSLLSVSLSASQNLYTRRGTLVGLSGKADNVCDYQETLSRLIN